MAVGDALRWRFSLHVGKDSVASLRWSYTTTRSRRGTEPGEKRETVRVETWTRDGRQLLNRADVPERMRTNIDPNESRFLGDVAFHPETGVIRILRDDVLLIELKVPATKPTIRLTERRVEKARQELTWEATSDETGQRWYSLFIELDDGRRYPIGRRTTDPRYPFDAAKLPGCRAGRIVVRVSDGVWTAEDRTEPISIAAKQPLLWILWPRAGASLRLRQPLQLSGQGWDVQRQQPLPPDRLHWSLDGKEIGHGRLMLAPSLGRGRHVVELSARDEAAGPSSSRVEVEVV